MLAYIASIKGEEWCTLVHGETRGKAKYRFYRNSPQWIDKEDWVFIRLRRLPGQDDKPFTFETALAAGFQYNNEMEDGDPDPEGFTHDCDCPLCKRRRR